MAASGPFNPLAVAGRDVVAARVVRNFDEVWSSPLTASTLRMVKYLPRLRSSIGFLRYSCWRIAGLLGRKPQTYHVVRLFSLTASLRERGLPICQSNSPRNSS